MHCNSHTRCRKTVAMLSGAVTHGGVISAVHGIDNGSKEKLFCLELMLPNEMFAEFVKRECDVLATCLPPDCRQPASW
jgi:hypothetical protein